MAAYFSLVKTLDATLSISAPVWRELPRWDRVDAARLFAICDELLLDKVAAATEAIRLDVCFVFFDMLRPLI